MIQLHDELNRMNWYLFESIKKWERELEPIINRLHSNRHWQALPYHTIIINRFLGSSMDDAARLGAIFRLFVLSDHVHLRVQDDEEGQLYDEELQFNILIGDLMYGSALNLLCDRGWYKLLPLLTEMIVQVNEGHALVISDPRVDVIQIAAKEWGSYYQSAFQAAAVINDLTSEHCLRLAGIGMDLGLSITARELGLGNVSVFSNRYQEGMDWLSNNLPVNSNYKRMDIWMTESGKQISVAG